MSEEPPLPQTERMNKWINENLDWLFRPQDFLRWIIDILLILWLVPLVPIFWLIDYQKTKRERELRNQSAKGKVK